MSPAHGRWHPSITGLPFLLDPGNELINNKEVNCLVLQTQPYSEQEKTRALTRENVPHLDSGGPVCFEPRQVLQIGLS